MEIPEWSVFETGEPFDAPDVVIRLATSKEAPPPGDHDLPIIEAGRYCFTIPEAGHYRVTQGQEIAVTLTPGAEAREVRLFLLGSAWGALCYQRGLLALHASVVEVGDSAVAFCGATGSGKSAVAAWLTERGYRLVSDDLCRFEVPTHGPPLVYPSSPRLKLWRDALYALGRSDAGLERDHFREDKFHWPLPISSGRQPLPLRAIYLLEWGETAVARLTGVTALRRFVVAATYRGELLEPMGQVAAHWERCVALARRVPIWEFSCPRDWSAMETVIGMLRVDNQLAIEIPA